MGGEAGSPASPPAASPWNVPEPWTLCTGCCGRDSGSISPTGVCSPASALGGLLPRLRLQWRPHLGHRRAQLFEFRAENPRWLPFPEQPRQGDRPAAASLCTQTPELPEPPRPSWWAPLQSPGCPFLPVQRCSDTDPKDQVLAAWLGRLLPGPQTGSDRIPGRCGPGAHSPLRPHAKLQGIFLRLCQNKTAKHSLGWAIFGSFKISSKVEVSTTHQRGFLGLNLLPTKAYQATVRMNRLNRSRSDPRWSPLLGRPAPAPLPLPPLLSLLQLSEQFWMPCLRD